MRQFWIIFFISLITGWVTSQARSRKARRVDQSIIFGLAPLMAAVFVGCAVMGATFVGVALAGRAEQPRLMYVHGGFAFMSLSVLGWPKAVVVSPSGIRQRSWVGRWKMIPWSELKEVKRQYDGTLLLVGRHKQIYFTQYQVDRDDLLSEIRSHSNTSLGSLDTSTPAKVERIKKQDSQPLGNLFRNLRNSLCPGN